MNIGETIRNFRLQKGMSQGDIEKRLNRTVPERVPPDVELRRRPADVEWGPANAAPLRDNRRVREGGHGHLAAGEVVGRPEMLYSGTV